MKRNAAAERDWRLKARLAVVELHLEDDRVAADMCRIDNRPDPSERTIFVDEFPAWHGDVTSLATFCQARSDAALRSGLCLAIGSIASAQLTDGERKAWEPALAQCYEAASDGSTHSARLAGLCGRGVSRHRAFGNQPTERGPAVAGQFARHDVAQDLPGRTRA